MLLDSQICFVCVCAWVSVRAISHTLLQAHVPIRHDVGLSVPVNTITVDYINIVCYTYYIMVYYTIV